MNELIRKADVLDEITREARRAGGDTLTKHYASMFKYAVIGITAIETCEDAISRKAAVSEMAMDDAEGKFKRIERIEALPSVAPRLKKGTWIPYEGMQPPEFHGKHYCSNCYHTLHLGLNGRVYRYCPNCGAKMKGER